MSSFITEPLPHKYTYAIDYWGYYNGKNNNASLLPDLKDLGFGQHLALGVEYETIQNAYKRMHFNKYADRRYSFTDCQAGMLSGIKYPTGGYTAYTYEPNSFLIDKLTDEVTRTVYANDQNHPSYNGIAEFKLKAKTTVTLNLNVYKGIDTWEHFYTIGKTKASLTRYTDTGAAGTVVYSYDFGSDCLQALESNLQGNLTRTDQISLDSHAPDGTAYTYRLVVDIPDALGNQSGPSTLHCSIEGTLTYVDPRHKEEVEMKGCGLRIKTINSYAQKGDSTPLITTAYDYTTPGTGKSSGILHDQVSFVKTYDKMMYVFYMYTGPVKTTINEEANSLEITGGNCISNPYGTCGGVGYSYVRESKKSGGQNTGYTQYRYKNSKPMNTQHSAQVNEPGNGKLLERTVYDADGKLMAYEEYTYSIKKVCGFFGINIFDRFNLMPGIYWKQSTWIPLNPAEINEHYTERMLIIQHQLNAYDITTTGQTVYNNGIRKKEKDAYDSGTLQLKRKTLLLNDNDSVVHTYTYPNNCNWEPYLTMTKKNRIGSPVEEKVFRNNCLTDGRLTEYKKQDNSGLILPWKQYRAKATGQTGNPTTYTSTGVNQAVYPQTDAICSRYDTDGNIEGVETNETKTVWLRAYNREYPVAKIEGATYAEVESWLGASAISSLATNTRTVPAALKDIRGKLAGKNVQVTTYTFQPLVGMTSMTAPNGEVTTYTYDPFGRLAKTTDHSGKTTETHEYNYKP